MLCSYGKFTLSKKERKLELYVGMNLLKRLYRVSNFFYIFPPPSYSFYSFLFLRTLFPCFQYVYGSHQFILVYLQRIVLYITLIEYFGDCFWIYDIVYLICTLELWLIMARFLKDFLQVVNVILAHVSVLASLPFLTMVKGSLQEFLPDIHDRELFLSKVSFIVKVDVFKLVNSFQEFFDLLNCCVFTFYMFELSRFYDLDLLHFVETILS